jgi:hypothetical protein
VKSLSHQKWNRSGFEFSDYMILKLWKFSKANSKFLNETKIKNVSFFWKIRWSEISNYGFFEDSIGSSYFLNDHHFVFIVWNYLSYLNVLQR